MRKELRPDLISAAQRCKQEIALRRQWLMDAYMPEEMEGILQGMQDWSMELRMIENICDHGRCNEQSSPELYCIVCDSHFCSVDCQSSHNMEYAR